MLTAAATKRVFVDRLVIRLLQVLNFETPIALKSEPASPPAFEQTTNDVRPSINTDVAGLMGLLEFFP
jgi:hypothetical protein